MMLTVALNISILVFAAAMVMNLWVVIRYERLADRILALDTMVINAISLIILYGMAYGTDVYFEAAMLIAMVGFISTVSYCRYILRGNIIE